MYGSSLMCVTLRPRASISAPIEAAPRPLPIDETTPPVTKTNLVRLLMAFAPDSFGDGDDAVIVEGREIDPPLAAPLHRSGSTLHGLTSKPPVSAGAHS